MLEFEWPQIFFLLPLPLLSYWLLPRYQTEEAALRIPFYQRLNSIGQATAAVTGRMHFKHLLLTLIWALLLLASSAPKWVGEPISLPVSGRDLLLAVDISQSMSEPDVIYQGERFTRLQAVKGVVGEFVSRRKGDRLGLILFGSKAYVQAPLTFNRLTVKTLLREAHEGFAGPATAIGDAIGLGIKRLQKRPQNHRILILLTDGQNSAGSIEPSKAAELAASQQIKIYTIGFTGRRGSNVDQNTLIDIAQKTGGQSFFAKSPESLFQIFAELDTLEPAEQEAETYRPSNSLSHWPLAGAFLLSLLMACAQLCWSRWPSVFRFNLNFSLRSRT